MPLVDTLMPLPISIYTDGSSLGNPGPGAYGVVIIDGKKETELQGTALKTTNNRMEMQGIIAALQWIKQQHLEYRHINLYSDSALLINTLNQSWKRRKNIDLWKQLDDARSGLNVTFQWLKGHAGQKYNERCDQIARKAASQLLKNSKKSTAESVPNTPIQLNFFALKSTDTGKYLCPKCHNETAGILSLLPASGHIRVDCPHCYSFIKFASPTPENKKIAARRTLLSNYQYQKIIEIYTAQGDPLSTKKLQQLKTWTHSEATLFIKKQQ